MALYPQAHIFVAGKDAFASGSCQKAMSRIATGNYAAMIVSHKSFELLPVSDETFKRFVDKQSDAPKEAVTRANRTAPILPLRPGLQERQTHDYRRHGRTTLFAAFNILNVKVIGTCQPRNRSREFIRFLNQLEKELPANGDAHLILDNYRTHKSADAQRWLKPEKRKRFQLPLHIHQQVLGSIRWNASSP